MLLLLPPALEAQERPETWDMSVEELRAVGLGQSRGAPIPVPDSAPRLNAENDPATGGSYAGVIFVNFDGANLSLAGMDDSRTDTTSNSLLGGAFAAYGEGVKREATMQAVREDWSAFNVLVVDQRPASGDYTMNMTGPTNPYGSNVLGIAPLDCQDQATHNNITFAFHSETDSHSASTHATTISQEVAHSYGLEHVNNPADIMNPTNAGADPSFLDTCIAIVPDPNFGILCTTQHAAECGTGNEQNSYAELMTLFGPAVPDTQAPEVAITSPQDGDSFVAGDNFSIDVDATDDGAVSSVELLVDGESQQTLTAPPWSFPVEDIPAGEYELSAIATDESGNETASASVFITVGINGEAPGDTDDDWPSGTSDGDDSDGSGSGGFDPSAGDTDNTDPGLPPGFGSGQDAADGCACSSGGPRGSAAWMFALLAFAAVRRRP